MKEVQAVNILNNNDDEKRKKEMKMKKISFIFVSLILCYFIINGTFKQTANGENQQ